MSDIYLQITETPTVVTLSAPVISGALSSTVTVANTVTVALDANSLSALENVTVTVGAAVTISNFPSSQAVSLASVPTHGVTLASTTVTVSSLPAISGTVTVGVLPSLQSSTDFVSVGEQIAEGINNYATIPVAVNWQDANQGIGSLLVTATCVTSTNRIGVVTIGGGTVTIGAGTAQIGSVTASISGTVPISISSVTVGNSVTIGSLPALAASTAQIGSVTASISGTVPISISSVTVGNSVTIGSCVTHGVTITNTVVTFFPAQGTTVANSNFTSITASTSLVSADSGREVLTVFNEGAGNLHISPGATCTTVAYQVRLSAGDYWECPAGQLTLAHTAVFATAGTARVSQVS